MSGRSRRSYSLGLQAVTETENSEVTDEEETLEAKDIEAKDVTKDKKKTEKTIVKVDGVSSSGSPKS